jgi:hypothetical protein
MFPHRSVGPVAPGLLIDASAGSNGCVDQVVFVFQSFGNGKPLGAALAPGYLVQYQDPARQPFMDGDPPQPISLPGNAFLVVKMAPAASVDPFRPDHPQTYLGNLSLTYGAHRHLLIVRKLPDQNGAVIWVIGLDARRPFVVDAAEDPTRITVDIS